VCYELHADEKKDGYRVLSRPIFSESFLGISKMLCIAEMDQDQNIQMNADMNNNGQFTAQWRL
jgi:hypothetical protein